MSRLGTLQPLKSIARLILSEVGAKPVTLVVLVCGMFVTYLQYQSFLASNRSEKSFQMVEEWELRGYKDDFDAYAMAILKLEAEAIGAGGPPLPYIQRKMTAPGPELSEHVAQLYYFFDKMSLCIERDLCDGDLLRDYFGRSVAGFWEHTIGYLDGRRKRSADFGQFTQAFVASIEKP